MVDKTVDKKGRPDSGPAASKYDDRFTMLELMSGLADSKGGFNDIKQALLALEESLKSSAKLVRIKEDPVPDWLKELSRKHENIVVLGGIDRKPVDVTTYMKPSDIYYHMEKLGLGEKCLALISDVSYSTFSKEGFPHAIVEVVDAIMRDVSYSTDLKLLAAIAEGLIPNEDNFDAELAGADRNRHMLMEIMVQNLLYRLPGLYEANGIERQEGDLIERISKKWYRD
ncbi:MAG: hypothetical protein M1544_00430 [Candidatus Marsarchaeota archaeon]|nr:hypothetical protein [Candidatus Marsarchaeota archaeon]MCL5101811.1 hypothetical protein [Candidatus Marsarchaeota archaeon]